MRKAKLYAVFCLLVMLLTLATGCKSNSTKLASDGTFQIDQGIDLDKLLSNLKYETSTQKDKKYIYVVSLDKNNGKVQKYEISQNATTEINVQKNKDFIISFPADKKSLYEWTIEKELDESLLKNSSKSWIRTTSIPLFKSGEQINRENFRFSTLRSGKQTVKFKYFSTKEKKSDTFLTSINIVVQ